ncbi:MAG TPA: nitrilase-related carbon-nitrogen hydrolase [Terriglobales bacterium]|nr:nitrilase-related carbon-nitrogen hydrolase [Terriglobales bacterium]
MQTSVAYKETHAGELPRAADRPSLSKSHSWFWLAIGAVLLLFSNGANNVPLAAWLAPAFVLRFVREQRLAIGLPIAYALLMAGFAFQFRGMVPIPGVAYYIFLLIFGLPLVLPYVIDRLVEPRLAGLTATLVFPTAWAATEYLMSRSLYGTWGSAAYSQYGNLPLLQILSVTGMWGITFLMGWFAAVCNWLWEDTLDNQRARAAGWLCAGAIVSVMLLGGARMALFPPSSQAVRVASISQRKIGPEVSDAVFGRAFEGKATSGDMDEIQGWAAALDNDLLSRAEREMQAGAKIVFWGETNAPVLKEGEAALVARGAGLASKYQVYLGMALGVLNAGKNPPLENKLVLIQPNGQVAWEYNKVRPVPGPEAAMQIRGDGKLRVLNTPYGRLSSIICFDGDFPQLLAQAGALGADVVLDPSNDWRAIDPWHTQMVSFRAIEQGVNLVRHTSKGLSATFDYQGRRLAAMDHYQTTDYAMISEVPTRGVRTIYSRLGDWFAWVCVAGLLLLVGRAVSARRGMNVGA